MALLGTAIRCLHRSGLRESEAAREAREASGENGPPSVITRQPRRHGYQDGGRSRTRSSAQGPCALIRYTQLPQRRRCQLCPER
ncbi:hypothetical protein SRHO_G00127500 [Serrasalmus rhombeus]